MPAFSKKSRAMLEQVHPDLQKVMEEAIKIIDFSITEGARTKEKQLEYFKAGKSKTLNSKHLPKYCAEYGRNYSCAIDVCPWPVDYGDRERFCLLAGIVLGIGTIMTNDMIVPVFQRPLSSKEALRCTRGCIALLLLVGCFLSTGALGDIILNFATMSMGLRASIIFAPFMCAVFLPGKISSHWVIASIFCGPGLVLLFGLWKVLPFDPLFAGIGGSILCCVIGCTKETTRNEAF